MRHSIVAWHSCKGAILYWRDHIFRTRLPHNIWNKAILSHTYKIKEIGKISFKEVIGEKNIDYICKFDQAYNWSPASNQSHELAVVCDKTSMDQIPFRFNCKHEMRWFSGV